MNNSCIFQLGCPGYWSHEWDNSREKTFVSNPFGVSGDPSFQPQKQNLRNITCCHCPNGVCQNSISSHFKTKVVA